MASKTKFVTLKPSVVDECFWAIVGVGGLVFVSWLIFG